VWRGAAGRRVSYSARAALYRGRWHTAGRIQVLVGSEVRHVRREAGASVRQACVEQRKGVLLARLKAAVQVVGSSQRPNSGAR